MAALNETGMAATFSYDVAGDTWVWSAPLRELHGLDLGEQPTTDHLVERMVAEDRPVMLERFRHHLTHRGPYTSVYRMVDPPGRIRTLRFVGHAIGPEDHVHTLRGFVLDVTGDVTAWQATAVYAAVEHRAAIDQAKGALMLAFHIDENEAFGMLRTFSSQHNRKLRDVAEAITAGLSDPQHTEADPIDLLLEIVAAVGQRGAHTSGENTLRRSLPASR